MASDNPIKSKYLAKITADAASPGWVAKTVTLTGKRLQLAYIYFDPGAEIPIHSHPQEAMVTLVMGSLEQWVGEEHFILYPGWVVWIPANIPHRAIAGQQQTIEIEAFAPIREEYASRTPDYDFRR